MNAGLAALLSACYQTAYLTPDGGSTEIIAPFVATLASNASCARSPGKSARISDDSRGWYPLKSYIHTGCERRFHPHHPRQITLASVIAATAAARKHGAGTGDGLDLEAVVEMRKRQEGEYDSENGLPMGKVRVVAEPKLGLPDVRKDVRKEWPDSGLRNHFQEYSG